MTNYTDIAMESLLCDAPVWRSATINRMVAESEYILSCLECGMILDPVQEAISKDTAKAIINQLKMFLNNVMAKFKGKVADYYEKYIPWVEKNAQQIKTAAEKSSVTLAPYWEGEVEKDKSALSNLPGEAFKIPYESDDVSFASKILSSVKTAEDLEDTAKVSNILKNKYRFNMEEEDNSKIKKVELKENALVQQVDKMIKYVLDYKKISDTLSKVSTQWQRLAEQFQEQATQESVELTKDTFLSIESACLQSTDLALLKGFDQLLESFDYHTSTAITEADDTNQSGNNSTSLTTVQNNNTTSDNGDVKKAPGGNNGRYRMADKFVRLAYSAFMTACEERFIVYIKVMSQILGESPNAGKKETK